MVVHNVVLPYVMLYSAMARNYPQRDNMAPNNPQRDNMQQNNPQRDMRPICDTHPSGRHI